MWICSLEIVSHVAVPVDVSGDLLCSPREGIYVAFCTIQKSLDQHIISASNELVPPVVGGCVHRIYPTILVYFDAFEANFRERLIPAASVDISRHYSWMLSSI